MENCDRWAESPSQQVDLAFNVFFMIYFFIRVSIVIIVHANGTVSLGDYFHFRSKNINTARKVLFLLILQMTLVITMFTQGQNYLVNLCYREIKVVCLHIMAMLLTLQYNTYICQIIHRHLVMIHDVLMYL